MLEEAAGFFIDWGFEWVPYYQLLAMTVFLLFGPFLMCFQTYKLYKWIQVQKAKENNRDVEDDPDFVQEDEDEDEDEAEEAKEDPSQAATAPSESDTNHQKAD